MPAAADEVGDDPGPQDHDGAGVAGAAMASRRRRCRGGVFDRSGVIDRAVERAGVHRIGLSGGAFLGSEAASALLLYTAKLATFGQFGVLTTSLVVRGMVVGAALMIGPFLTRTIVRRLRPHAYTLLIDTVLVAAAAGMFIATRTV